MVERKTPDSNDAFKLLSKFIITGGDDTPPLNIPTGYFNLDFAIHYGADPGNVNLNEMSNYDPKVPLGLPMGKIVEFYGEEGSGKSYLAYRVVGNAQKMGYNVAWIDAESSFSPTLAEINGCDIEKMILIQTAANDMYAEEVLDTIISLCKTERVPRVDKKGRSYDVHAPKVIVLDSIASLIPKIIEQTASEQQQIGLLARILSQNMGKIAAAAEKNGVLLICINQLREKIGTMYGSPDVSPGGHAIKHFFSVRLKITKRKTKEARIIRVDEDGVESLLGCHSYIQIEKNRFGRPYSQSIDIPIYYEAYFPNIEDILFDTGRQLKLISVRKGVFSWKDIKEEGREAFIKAVKSGGLVPSLLLDVKSKSIEEGTVLPPEIILHESQMNDEQVEKQDSGDGETEGGDSGKKNSKKRRGKTDPDISEE